MSQLALNGGPSARVRKWKKKSPEFQAVERMQEAKNLRLLAQDLGVSVRTLYRWKDIQLGRLKPVGEPQPRKKKLEGEIQRLKQALADRTLEVDFLIFSRCLAKGKGSTPGEYRDWRRGIYDEIPKSAGVSRAGFYRHLVEFELDATSQFV